MIFYSLTLQITDFSRIIDESKAEATRRQVKLEKLNSNIAQAKLAYQDLSERNTPELLPPLRITAGVQNNVFESPNTLETALSCTMTKRKCFDWSRCPISSGFPIYFYQEAINEENSWVISGGLKSGYLTSNPNSACLFVVSGTANNYWLSLKAFCICR